MTKHHGHYSGIFHRSSRAITAAALALVLLPGPACWAQEMLTRLPNTTELAAMPAAVPVGSAGSAFARQPESVITPPGLPQADNTGPSAADFARYVPQREPWRLQWVPDGLIYHSYLAGMKEPRIACSWVHERELGWIWDITLGGRVAVLRYGTDDPRWPEGWEVDIEGAAFPRLDIEENRDLVACDYRFGIPVTYGGQRYRTKLAYYHLSSHLGDEFMLKHQNARRINYSRDVIVWGHSLYLLDQDLRLYAEAGWAFNNDGGSEPREFQTGVAYSPARPTGGSGAPFVAINAHLRQEVNFGGNLVVEAGWQWRGETGRLFRLGSQYYSGMSEQYEFFDSFEDKVGFGIWYDF